MTSREKVLTRLDSTGIRREDEAAVPVNGVTVPLPYMVIRTIEKDTWDDLGENDHVDHCPIYCKQGHCT